MAHSGCCRVLLLSGCWDSASTRHLATLLSLAELLPGGHSCDTRQRVSWQWKLSAHFEWIRVPKWSSNLYRGLVSHALLGITQGSVLTPLLIGKKRKKKAARVWFPPLLHRVSRSALKKKKSHDCDPSGSKSVRNALLISMDFFFVKMPNRGVCLYSCYFQQKFYQASFRFFFFFSFYWLMHFCCSSESAAVKIPVPLIIILPWALLTLWEASVAPSQRLCLTIRHTKHLFRGQRKNAA